MRWILYLVLYIPVQLLSYLITPLLPLFATMQYGSIDNANGFASEPRLPSWLNYLMTPDNSLWGDNNWKKSRDATSYWSMVGWLYRNNLYGFKWSVLAAPMIGEKVTRTGAFQLDYHTKQFGVQRFTMGNYWQYKCVKPFMGKILVLNFGWLLDDCSQKRALFMFSPRLK
jgi:hypothetical protein